MACAHTLGEMAPNFEADTQMGRMKFHEYMNGHYCVFFSHPGDFTPVCTTEMGRVAQLHNEWEKRNVKVMGLSVDTSEEHKNWIHDIEQQANAKVNFPIAADPNRQIATMFGMLDPSNKDSKGMPLTVRSMFIYDTNKKLRLMLNYPGTVGRNFDEVLRCIDALQTVDKYHVATPVDWKPGNKVIIPQSMPDDKAKEFGDFKVHETPSHKQYLRMGHVPSH